MLILAIESSCLTASCAICSENGILCENSNTTKLTHSQTLMPLIENLFKISKINLKEISAIAVSIGPGSFTGLRIGLSCAKGIAAALQIPIVGISTLLGLARNYEISNSILCPAVDARNNQIYHAKFSYEASKLLRLCEDSAIQIADLKTEIENSKKNYILLGEFAAELQKKINCKNCIAAPINLTLPRASSIAFCALSNFNELVKNEAINSPNYLKLSQAERMLNLKLNEKKD